MTLYYIFKTYTSIEQQFHIMWAIAIAIIVGYIILAIWKDGRAE
jgi:hypothetical protein